MSHGRSTTLKSLRIPDTIVDRIQHLATRRSMSFNEWCNRALDKAAAVRQKKSPRIAS